MIGGICTFCYNRKLILKSKEFSKKPFYTSFLEGCFCCFLAGTEKDRSIVSCCLLTASTVACVASVRPVQFLLSKNLILLPSTRKVQPHCQLVPVLSFTAFCSCYYQYVERHVFNVSFSYKQKPKPVCIPHECSAYWGFLATCMFCQPNSLTLSHCRERVSFHLFFILGQ